MSALLRRPGACLDRDSVRAEIHSQTRAALVAAGESCPDTVMAHAQAERDARNLSDAVARARVTVRRYVRSHALTGLLTFTNGGECGGWKSRSDALADVSAFLKEYRVRCFGDVPILCVAERGGEGDRWHVHAGIPRVGWLDYSGIIHLWSAFLTRRGYLAPTGTHRWHRGDENNRHKGNMSSARVMAGYLTKYMAKGLKECAWIKGEHRYRAAGGCAPRAYRVSSYHAETLRKMLVLGVPELRPVFDARSGQFRCYCFDSTHTPDLCPDLDGAVIAEIYDPNRGWITERLTVIAAPALDPRRAVDPLPVADPVSWPVAVPTYADQVAFDLSGLA